MIKNYYPTYFVTGASLVDGKLVLNVNGSPSMSEHIHFALRFAPRVAIPSGVALNTPVSLSINETTVDFLDKYAEPVTFSELPKDRINDNFFSPRFAIVGGVGSSTTTSEETTTTTYYYVAWDIPAI